MCFVLIVVIIIFFKGTFSSVKKHKGRGMTGFTGYLVMLTLAFHSHYKERDLRAKVASIVCSVSTSLLTSSYGLTPNAQTPSLSSLKST